jgi:hypothetical protein
MPKVTLTRRSSINHFFVDKPRFHSSNYKIVPNYFIVRATAHGLIKVRYLALFSLFL